MIQRVPGHHHVRSRMVSRIVLLAGLVMMAGTTGCLSSPAASGDTAETSATPDGQWCPDICLTERDVDLDGDQSPDHLTLSYVPVGNDQARALLRVTLKSGVKTYEGEPGEAESSYNAKLLGVADLNADRRPEIAIIEGTGAHTMFGALLTVRDDALHPVRDLATGRPFPLFLDGAYASEAGFLCQNTATVLTYGVSRHDDRTMIGSQQTWQWDGPDLRMTGKPRPVRFSSGQGIADTGRSGLEPGMRCAGISKF